MVGGSHHLRRVILAWLVAIIVIPILAYISLAATFSYYSAYVTAAAVDPPLIYVQASYPQVSPKGTYANITIYQPYSLELYSNPVIFSYTFDTGLPSDWVAVSGTWSDSTTTWVGGSVTSASGTDPNKASRSYTFFTGVAYNLSAFVRGSSVAAGRYVGIGFYNTATDYFIGCAIGNGGDINIISISGNTVTVLAASDLSLAANTWYFLVCRIVIGASSSVINAYVFSTVNGNLLGSVSYTYTGSLSVNAIAMIVRRTTGYFDEMVFTTGDPRHICVTNVPAGWVFELRNGSSASYSVLGSVISPGTNAMNCIPLYFGSGRSTILRSASIAVIDTTNTNRIPNNYGSKVASQIYRIYVDSSTTAAMHVQNLDSKPYYARLYLDSYTISPNFYETASIYMESALGSTTAVTVPGATGVYTSELLINIYSSAGSSASIVVNITVNDRYASVGATAKIYLYLFYSTKSGMDGVVVRYPLIINLI